MLYFVSSYLANKKAGALDKAKNELMMAEAQEQTLQIAKIKTDAEEQINKVKTESDKQIALLKVQAAQANEKAESEKLARLKLEISLMPRHFTEQQKSKLIEILRQGPKGPIFEIWCVISNAESEKFASEISDYAQRA